MIIIRLPECAISTLQPRERLKIAIFEIKEL